MASTAAFFTTSDADYERKQDPSHFVRKTDDAQIDTVYEIDRCAAWIEHSGFTKVALQFPDELMGDSFAVTNKLEKAVKTQCNIFILGDTSYGSCCVDEVAAQHYNADALIHYGRSCLSQPCQMPVLFVFGRQPIDVADCVEQFTNLFLDRSANVIVLYDTVYSYIIDDFSARVCESYSQVVVSRLVVMTEPVSEITSERSEVSDSHANSCSQRTITQCGRTFSIPHKKNLSSFSAFYIGKESATLTNLIYQFQPCEFYTYNPETREGRRETINVNKMLMKRYFMVEKAKDASIIGILVGTLGVANYLQILNRLKELIKKAGKKSYVFIVGKINVAKLANFMEIDVFVLIACAENTLLDSSEFYKPVVTPYEMELACNREREWTGDYPTDFSKLLEGGSHYEKIPDCIEQEDTDVSLVTGKLRRLGKDADTVETGNSIMLRSDAMGIATQADTAGEFLNMRSWKGLEQSLGETPVSGAIEGQEGIAMGYNTEPK